MSDTYNFDVELPDGRIITVEGAPNADAARQRVTAFLQEERRARPLGGFFENFARAGRGALGSVVEGAGAVAGEAGLPGEQTLREFGADIAGQTPTDRHSFEGFSDLREQFMRRPGETARAALGQALGSLAGSVAAPVAVGAGLAAAGASAPVVAGAGLAAAIASGALQSTNELEEILKQEGVDAARARELAVQIGPAIGAVEGGAAGALLSRVLGRQIRRESAEQLARIAARSRTASGIREGAVGAALEGGSEGLGGAARQGVAASETGNVNLGERADQVALDALLGAVGGGGVGAAGGVRQPGQAARELASLPVPPTPDQEPAAETPPEEFGPTAPSLPPEPPPVEDLDTALQVLTRDNIALPRDIDEAGILAMANLSERARYRDQVAQIRDNEVARFTGLNDVIVRPGEPNDEGVADDVADFTRAAPTLIRNVLSAMQSGAIEGDRFNTRQVIGLAVEGLGLEASAVPRRMQNVVTQYLDGLAQAGYLNKIGKTYEINLRTREPQGARATDGNLTAEERSAQAVLPLLQAYQNNPTNANRQAVERAVRDTQLKTEISNFFTLQQKRQNYINERDALAQKPALTQKESENLRNLEANIAATSTNLARIVDSLEGRAQGRAIAMPDKAPRFSDQVGRSQPAVDPDEVEFNQQFAREMNAAAARTIAPVLSNPNVQIDDAQIANAIIERPQEARDLVQSLAADVPQGTPFRATDIVNAARARGIPLTPQNGVQLYNIARMTGVVDRNGTVRQPTNLGAARGFAPADQQLTRAANIQDAEKTFRRMLGNRGRLEFRDRLLLSDLNEEIQRIAAEYGIEEINGAAVGDLAILSLANPEINLREVAIHEGFHVADYLGLITPNERKILDANSNKIIEAIKKYLPEGAWNELSDYITNKPAEIRAWGINARIAYNLDFKVPAINRILDKIAQFVERIGNFLRGRGFTDWRQIYDRLYAGEFANRVAAPDPANTTDTNLMADVIEARGGVNVQRLAKMLGPQLYGDVVKDLGNINVKELYQNSFDAVKAALESGQTQRGKIDIGLHGHKIKITDNGVGMTPEILTGKFLEIAGTGKEDRASSGGFGIAKMLFLYANTNLDVITARDGKIARMQTTGPKLMASLDKGGASIPVTVQNFQDSPDSYLFPEGHGTHIEIEMPETIKDVNSGIDTAVNGVYDPAYITALKHSPLFANIDVTVNGRPLENAGNTFNPNKYTNLANVAFSWGSARIFVTKKADPNLSYGDNLHVLSNGLYQFSSRIKKDPKNSWSGPVPYTFYVDIKPTVRPDQPGYPFAFNRKNFSETGKKDFNNVLNYINALYYDKTLQEATKSFGKFYYINPRNGKRTITQELRPTARTVDNALTAALNAQDRLEVRDGTLYSNGRALPDLPADKLKASLPDTNDLKIDPKLIDPNMVMIHDGTIFIDPETGQEQQVLEYLENKFGQQRVQQYLRFVGTAFKQLRDAVADVLEYDYLRFEAIGLSLSPDYRGVSIRVPFNGSFLNPLAPESADPTEASYGLIGTMIHELAHHKVRSHDETFPQEMQRIQFKLLASASKKGSGSSFNFIRFQERFVNEITRNYSDILMEGRNVFESGYVKNVGNVFKDASYQRRQNPSPPRVSTGNRGVGRTTGAGQPVQSNIGGSVGQSGQRAGTGAGSPLANQLRQGARAKAIHRATKDELTGLLRWFGSPIMTIGKVLPNHRAAADTQKQLYTRANEMINETESLIESTYKLPPQSVAKITRVWNEASRKRQPPNLTGLTVAERDALRQQMAATQRGLDYMIESMVLENFLPDRAKNPVERQRLEAFWNRHQDKHLWEIPQRELMAASPEGYREMQRLERLRNPYYMPMVGRGSHFVAAYQRKPNGDRGKIVGLVAYEPLTIRQKLLRKWNRAEDPEQAAIRQLQNEFNDPRKYIVMQKGVQFTNDSQAEQIRAQGDFIAQYMEKVRQAASATGNTKVLETVRAMTAQMDKAQLERIFRPNNDILRAVTPQNEASYILDVMPQYLLSLAKVQARRYTQEGFKEATKNMTPNDREYWSTLRDYATSPSEAFGNLRALAFFQYLGFALDTAFINLTQNLHTNAMLVRDGGLIGSKIFAQVAGRMGVNADAKTLTDPSGFVKNYITKYASPNEKIALERAMEQGIFAPVFTNESRSQFTVEGLRRAGFKNPEKAYRRLTKLSRWAGLPMQFVEAYNRAIAFTAAYKLAEQNPSVIARANQIDGTQYANPYDYAVGKVIDTQFLTTKEDRALFQRFTPAAELATQFLSYPFKAMEQYIRAGAQVIKGMAQDDPVMARAGAVSLLLMMGPLIMLAGVFALPFADFAKELAEDLVGAVWGSPQNFEMDMREMLGGGRGAEFVLGGGLQAMGIASLRRRLALDPVPYNDLLSLNTVGNLFGPVGSIIEIPQNAYQYYQNGDYMQMAAALMPRAAGNVVRGAQIAIEKQQYTRRGNRVITPEIVQEAGNLFGGVLPANISAGIRTAFGFAPPEFVREREIVSTAEELSRATRSRSERYSKELARILVRMLEAQRDNNMDEAVRLGQQYGDRLREISEAELQRPTYLQVMPNHSSILRRALRDFYGIGSEETLSITGRRNAREEVLRQRALIDWRNQQN